MKGAQMTNTEIKDVLVRALARLKDGAAWTQNYFARDDAGKECMPENPEAVCWCAIGAVYAELGPMSTWSPGQFAIVSKPLRIVGSVSSFNDNARDFTPVRELYERAIASLE